MLKPVLVAMTLMGCDCDARVCVPLGPAGPGWASIEECEAAVAATIRQGADATYPLVTARCEAVADAEPEILRVHVLAEASAGRSALASAGEAGLWIATQAGDRFFALGSGFARSLADASGLAAVAASRVRQWGLRAR